MILQTENFANELAEMRRVFYAKSFCIWIDDFKGSITNFQNFLAYTKRAVCH